MSASVHVEVTVNGEKREDDVEARLLLVYWLRDELGLTGTHVGCDTTNCGACTVHLNGEAVKSCTVLTAQVDGAEVTTIEGLSNGNGLHPVQAAFWEKHGLQCGFCTPGMIMTAIDLLAHNPDPTEHEIRHGFEGNYWPCTGYQNIVAAVQLAAKTMRGANASSLTARPEPVPVSSSPTGEPAGAGV